MLNNKKHLSRRNFLRIIAAVSGTAVLWKFGLDKLDSQLVTKDSKYLMGTIVNLTLLGGNQEQAQETISNVFSRMETLEAILSRFLPESDLSRLNRSSVLHSPNAILVDLLLQAQEVSLATNGAFDVTVKPLIDLYEGRFIKRKGLPDVSEIENILPLVNYKKLHISEQKIWFERGEMGATIDGIAKGYIVDESVKQLLEAGYKNIMMEAGGDLLALGERDTNRPWRVGIQAPRASMGELLTQIDVTNKAIATSGDYMQPYSSDLRYHHIVDPHTGYSSPYLASATVIAPSCWKADALATALMVKDVQSGMALVKEINDIEAILVTKGLETISTF